MKTITNFCNIETTHTKNLVYYFLLQFAAVQSRFTLSALLLFVWLKSSFGRLEYGCALAELIQNSGMTRFNLPFQAGTGRILVTQTIVTLVGTIIFAFVGIVALYSALLGGIACLLPSAYSIWRVFGKNRAVHQLDPRIFGIMLRAEFVKFAITGIVFAVFFWLINPIDPIAMFSVFTVAMFAGWIEAGLRIG